MLQKNAVRSTLFVIASFVILFSTNSSEIRLASLDGKRPVSKSSKTKSDDSLYDNVKFPNTNSDGSLYEYIESHNDDSIKKSTGLRQGDLPGYTGWARPTNTLAGSFSIAGITMVENHWTCTIHCDHPACAAGGSLFYVRAYGPAVLPGLVTDHGNGTYDISVLAFDEGLYAVEVVLSFSNHPAWSDFPVQQETAFEGYLLPGFPVTMKVVNGKSKNKSPSSGTKIKTKLPVCNMSMLTETSTYSALASGRWVVQKTNMDDPYVDQTLLPASLESYQAGDTSLGIAMEYVPTTCSLLSEGAALNPRTLKRCHENGKKKRNAGDDDNNNNNNSSRNLRNSSNCPRHVIFIGDSNMLKQYDMFHQFFGKGLETTRITTNGGILATLANIQEQLKQLAEEEPEKDYFVIFNSGLHDIDKFCHHEMWRTTRAPLIHNISDDDFSCLQLYRESLLELVTTVAAFPARVRVWQTTTAGWPKWGNYGGAWSIKRWQILPADPTAVLYWNEVALEVLQPFVDSHEIAVMDAYWLSLSRPDHRESDPHNDIGKKMVHAGPQVYSVLMRKWAMLILHAICPNAW
jgi:hypothetical protein